MEKSNLPIVVLQRDDGNKVLSILEENEENIQARVNAESNVDTPNNTEGTKELSEEKEPGVTHGKQLNYFKSYLH